MAKKLTSAAAVYFASIIVLCVLGTAVGSFVVWGWWTPLDYAAARGVAVYISIYPAAIYYLKVLRKD